MSGKGSAPRPFSVPADEYAERFEAIFGKKKLARTPEEISRAIYASEGGCSLDDALQAFADVTRKPRKDAEPDEQ